MEVDGETGLASTVATLRITPDALSLVSEIDEFKGAWRAIGRVAPDRLTRLRHVATIESIGSSTRIEGARLSNLDVERLLSNLRLQSFATRDEQEVAGCAEVMRAVFEHWADIPPNENHIRQLHRDLLTHSPKDERHRGTYKTITNHVEAFDVNGASLGVVFATATPFDTPRLMGELVTWLLATQDGKAPHPLLAIAIFIVVFLEIHPFQDGNGRLSRALTALLLLRAGYSYAPYSSLESVVEQNKEGYHLARRSAQGTIRAAVPDWQPWLSFFLRALREQKRRLERKVERELLILGDRPELSIQILELARERGRVTVAEAAKVTGQSRHTVKDHLKALANHGHVTLHGAGRGAWHGLG